MTGDDRLVRGEEIVDGRLALTVPAGQVCGTGVGNTLYSASQIRHLALTDGQRGGGIPQRAIGAGGQIGHGEFAQPALHRGAVLPVRRLTAKAQVPGGGDATGRRVGEDLGQPRYQRTLVAAGAPGTLRGDYVEPAVQNAPQV